MMDIEKPYRTFCRICRKQFMAASKHVEHCDDCQENIDEGGYDAIHQGMVDFANGNIYPIETLWDDIDDPDI